MNIEPTSAVIGIVIGTILIAPIIYALILPDRWGIWLVLRENLPRWLGPLAGLGLIAFVVFFVGALEITLHPMYAWAYYLGIGSFVLLIIAGVVYFIYRNRPRANIDNILAEHHQAPVNNHVPVAEQTHVL